MPYIAQDKRKLYDDYIHAFEFMHAGTITDGELNYLITSLCHSVVKKQGLKYKVLNMIGGVLHYAGLEFYRTVCAPYEDRKSTENGPVSILDTPGHPAPPMGYSAEQRRALEDTR